MQNSWIDYRSKNSGHLIELSFALGKINTLSMFLRRMWYNQLIVNIHRSQIMQKDRLNQLYKLIVQKMELGLVWGPIGRLLGAVLQISYNHKQALSFTHTQKKKKIMTKCNLPPCDLVLSFAAWPSWLLKITNNSYKFCLINDMRASCAPILSMAWEIGLSLVKRQ